MTSTALPARPLGQTGLRLPVVWVGTATFGGIGSDPALHGLGIDPDRAPDILDAAFDAGITVVDTADSYTGGTSERAVGTWLARDRQRAAGVVIATKTGVRTPYPTRDLSPAHIEESVRGSLQRLGLDRIELLMSHRPDPATPVRAVVEKFAELIDRGLVGHVGACNVTAAEVTELLAVAEQAGLPRIEWVQNRFNLAVQASQHDVLQVCRDSNLGYVAHSVLAGGVLGGRRSTDAVPSGSRLAVKPEVYDQYRTPEMSAAISAFGREAEDLGVPVAALAQAWVLNVPGVSGLVAGPQRPGHIAASVAAARLTLDPETHARIGSLFAAPAHS
jgi:aryl-alcohol dehydrogenase-like predicted oxidoreductase